MVSEAIFVAWFYWDWDSKEHLKKKSLKKKWEQLNERIISIYSSTISSPLFSTDNK